MIRSMYIYFMKLIPTIALFSLLSCNAQEKTSQKKFDNITLLNKIEFVNPKYDQPKFSCGFLLQYLNDTFAVTAKHLLQVIKPAEMNTLSFENTVKSWTMFAMDKKEEAVITYKLINENKSESLENKASFENDWLVFSVKENHSKVKPLVPRTTALVPGEKLYVVGWTRKMEEGPQRVYEFEYYKTIGHRILLKELIVPEQFGGLSGAPLVDEQGFVVGLVSNGTVDPVTNKKYFSPCMIDNLLLSLQTEKKE